STGGLPHICENCPSGGGCAHAPKKDGAPPKLPPVPRIRGIPPPRARARRPRLLAAADVAVALPAERLARRRVERRSVARVMHGQVLGAATAHTFFQRLRSSEARSRLP